MPSIPFLGTFLWSCHVLLFLLVSGISSAKIEKIKQDESVDAEAVETKSEKLNKLKKPKVVKF